MLIGEDGYNPDEALRNRSLGFVEIDPGAAELDEDVRSRSRARIGIRGEAVENRFVDWFLSFLVFEMVRKKIETTSS